MSIFKKLFVCGLNDQLSFYVYNMLPHFPYLFRNVKMRIQVEKCISILSFLLTKDGQEGIDKNISILLANFLFKINKLSVAHASRHVWLGMG